jgi:SpoVK/Ycf46/Vps4 family AAA+-type ATPase
MSTENTMNTISQVIDVIIANITSIIPMLILKNTDIGIDPITLMMVPMCVKIIMPIITRIYEWIIFKEYENVYIISINQYTWRDNRHKAFQGLVHYLKNNNEPIYNWTSDAYTNIYNDATQSYYNMAEYTPDETSQEHKWTPMINNKNIKYCIAKKDNSGSSNTSINLLKSTDSIDTSNSYIIKLMADKKETITEFVTSCILDREQHLLTIVQSTYQIYRWDDGDWNGDTIPVIKTFDNIFLPKNIKEQLLDSIDTFTNAKQFYQDNGIPYKKGYIFYGDPGTGKTSTIYAITQQLKSNMYMVDLNKPLDFIKSIRKIKPGSVVVFEDIDTANGVQKRSNDEKDEKDEKDEDDEKDDDAKLSKYFGFEILGKLLEVLDGYNYLDKCYIILTTNHLDKLDKALYRPGRIDEKYKFGYLDIETFIDIVSHFYKDNETFEFIKSKEFKLTNQITSAFLINTIILPHINNPKWVKTWINQGCKIEYDIITTKEV